MTNEQFARDLAVSRGIELFHVRGSSLIRLIAPSGRVFACNDQQVVCQGYRAGVEPRPEREAAAWQRIVDDLRFGLVDNDQRFLDDHIKVIKVEI